MENENEVSWMELFTYSLVGALFIVGIWPAIFLAGLVGLPFAIVGGGIKWMRGKVHVLVQKRVPARESAGK
jgi:hypothetical protein